MCRACAEDGDTEVQLANNLWPAGSIANRRDRAWGPAGRRQPTPLTEAEGSSLKGVLRRSFPGKPKGQLATRDTQRGDKGTGWARAELAWVPTHGVQSSAPSASLGCLSGMPTPGPPRPAVSRWAFEHHPLLGSLCSQKLEKHCFRASLSSACQRTKCCRD